MIGTIFGSSCAEGVQSVDDFCFLGKYGKSSEANIV